MREDAQERLRRQADHVLLLERHGGVHACGAALARVGDARRAGKEEAGRQQLEYPPVIRS